MSTHIPHVPHPFLRFAIDHPQAGNWIVLAVITLAAILMWTLQS